MPTELSVHAVHQGGMHFTAAAGTHTVSMDYPLQPGEAGHGPKPLEMLLASLACCAGGTLAALLVRRMMQPLGGLEVRVTGHRRDEHPTVVTDIVMEFVLSGSGLDPHAVARAVVLAEQQLCPVWAMLKPGTRIASSFRIDAGSEVYRAAP